MAFNKGADRSSYGVVEVAVVGEGCGAMMTVPVLVDVFPQVKNSASI
jgi:hypothetical protein